MGREYDDIVDEGIKGVLDVFQGAIMHIKFLFPLIMVPWEMMDLQKKVVDGEIISDDEEACEADEDTRKYDEHRREV